MGLVFAYADPPYPGRARKYYGKEASYGGEVDHRELIASLTAAGYAGWALSTAADALRAVLPLCPPEARVCAWVKPIGAAPRTYGLHNTWEPLIVVPGRRLRPGRRDWLSAQPARGGGALPGRKPIAFCAWLFDSLGMLPGDELVDLFPGTGVVGRAWAEASGYASARARDDASVRSSANGDGVNLVPITVQDAREFVRQHHRHHPPPVSGLFAVACSEGGPIVGVAIVGRPVARGLQDGWTAEVTRVATDGSRNACSMLYGACWRAARALGYRRLVTYTLEEEGGTSLRASGWKVVAQVEGGSWSCASRPRVDKHPTQAKLRWEPK